MRMKGVAMAARRTSRAWSLPLATRSRLRPLLKARATARAKSKGATRGPLPLRGHPYGPFGCSVALQPPPLRGTPLGGGAGRSAPIRPVLLGREAPTRMSNLIAAR